MTRSKVKSRSHHDITHHQTPTNVPTKYQFPTPYGFRDIAQTRFCRARSPARSKVKSRSHHYVAHVQPLTNVPTKYQLPTPVFSDIARTGFLGHGHYSKVKGQIKVTP